MIGIPYIQQLFQNILAQDQVIQGRYFLAPKWANELNSETLDAIVQLALPNIPRYPCVLQMFPELEGNFQFSGEDVTGSEIGYNRYKFWMIFVRPSTYTSYNQPSQPATKVNTLSTHTIPQTWHDMQRCAESFMQVLYNVLGNQRYNQSIHIAEKTTQKINYISDLANDKVSGVLLSFTLLVNGGCEIEGYPANYLDLIQVPPLVDTHPQHINS